MKVTRPIHQIKARGRFLSLTSLLTGTLALLAPACSHGGVALAPFSARPGMASRGDLLGPFDGQVLDAATAKPVSGAVVYASWGFRSGGALEVPAGAAATSVETNADGRYQLPRITRRPLPPAAVASFTLIVYKRGFIGYRSDRRFEDLGARRDFAQHDCVIRLDRMTPGTSTVRHLRFLGGGGPIRRALLGEQVQAALELGRHAASGTAAGQEARPLLDASPLLSIDELKAATHYEGEFQVERLGDLPRSATYDSRHFRAVGKAESFDVAIRVWKPRDVVELDAAYDGLHRTLPVESEASELGDCAFRAKDGPLYAVVAEDRTRGAVIELTCGLDLCKGEAQVVSLARRVLARTASLGQASESPPPGSPPTAPEATPTAPEATPTAPEMPPSPAPDVGPFQLRPPGLHR